ncbi:MAG: hypothetical protein QGF28_04755 [Candidatus Thalassarchaeaceae archaeon]|jgi:hypothetical protein|nr:hypothetical protein [Candidatus Thalassarchaeaceae archaeon]MDP7092261.1 hypothetical protein [Candidatus Thalassarchaeaceae archaeon]MDP7256913.1 hypothetical protein [Candidatus Thalassarchaeaceae archaeon]MDP7446492.1 hypothetical protein [Candidatus Thalassarchaeaceae archaeon]MDP7649067.1 hypothetical protein [Candidatus Thalassarchaeaceae archaeon]
MKKAEREKLLAAAIAAVLSRASGGEVLHTSPQRKGGSAWSEDHRRIATGQRSLFRARTKRSTIR